MDPTLWQWKVLLSYKWKQQGHITLLESVAVLDLLKKLTRTAEVTNKKVILMVDNQGVVGILAKGRSSARMMQNPLRPDHCAPARLQCAPPRGLGED